MLVTKFSLSNREEEDWKKKIVTPRVAVTGCVESPDRKSVLIIKRKFPPYGYAFPGGMMELGETIEETAKREILEETGIDADVLSLLGINSHPFDDPRWHVVVVCVLMRATKNKEPKGGDDALEAFWVPYESNEYGLISSSERALEDYRKWREKEIALPKPR